MLAACAGATAVHVNVVAVFVAEQPVSVQFAAPFVTISVSGTLKTAGTATVRTLLVPATSPAVIGAVTNPAERAIGGCVASTGPYGLPLFGGAARQAPSSCTGAVAVTPGSVVMSFAKSDSITRRLAFVNRRSLSSTGAVTFSLATGR